MFHYFKHRRESRKVAQDLYEKTVQHIRQPYFYAVLGVKDDFTGRFDLLCLHVAITMWQLSKQGQVKTSQALFDVFFRSMEENLREQGVGDLGVPKHMKRMMQGFHGRRQSYWQAIDQEQSLENIKSILKDNLYGREENPSDAILLDWVDYIKEAASMLSVGDFSAMIERRKEKCCA